MNIVEKIKERIVLPKSFYTIGIHNTLDSKHLDICHFEIKKQHIHLKENLSFKSDDKSELNNLNNLPCIILVTGKKVIYKQIDQNKSNPIGILFPNIAESDLVWEDFCEEENQRIITAIRKETLQQLLKLIPSHLPIIEVRIGFYAILNIAKRFDLSDKYFEKDNFPDIVLKYPDFNQCPVDVLILGEHVKMSSVPSFLLAINFFAEKYYRCNYEIIRKRREDWFYGKLTKILLHYGGSVLMLLLLVSFLVYSHYYSKNGMIKEDINNIEMHSQDIVSLKNSFDEKRKIVQRINGRYSQISKMINEIALATPKEVILSTLFYNPLKNKLKDGKKSQFYKNEFHISGKTKGYNNFDLFKNKLRNFDWVQKVDVDGYREINGSHVADFKIMLVIND